ncbi:unnamed protein product [Diplocarpon coronariae]|uniref:Amidoligase enzyme n=1 Tax=Diplocarpon coronariae TaxID=2795749 RepID=A0A218YX25_9HELO|nr:hypothetical protein B2J93_3949 [Marssonina coronariae]
MASGSVVAGLPQPATIRRDAVRYGVELECVFVFHEDQIMPGRYNGESIETRKSLDYKQRSERRFSRCDPRFVNDRIYNSWGRFCEAKMDNQNLNPYTSEPLLIARDVLRRKVKALGPDPRNPRVMGTMTPADKKSIDWDSGRWILTPDASVCGVGSENIAKWLPNKVLAPGQTWDSFDSYGIEIVSPILNSNEMNDKFRIRDIVGAIRGSDTENNAAFVTNQCGLHVHVEAPTASDFRKDPDPGTEAVDETTEAKEVREAAEQAGAESLADAVKKELAMILLVYEDEIARLHPPCRRPGHLNAAFSSSSNRLGLIKEGLDRFPGRLCGPGVDTSMAACTNLTEPVGGVTGVDCSLRAVSQVASIPDIRAAMEKATVEQMVELLNWPAVSRFNEKPNRENGDKDRQVNLTYMVRSGNLPKTIEFRQAKGSLDFGDISRWADFCVGLVRLARLYVEDRSRFPVQNWGDTLLADGTTQYNRIDVFDLICDMELGQTASEYWERRVERFMLGKVGDENDRLDDEKPPAASLPPDARPRSWNERKASQ